MECRCTCIVVDVIVKALCLCGDPVGVDLLRRNSTNSWMEL